MGKRDDFLTRAAGVCFYTGVVAFLLGCWAKKNLPQVIALSPALQLPCAFFSAVLIPFASLLAFRQLIAGVGKCRTLLFYHLFANLFLIGILSLYFFEFYVLKSVIDLTGPRDFIVKLVKSASDAPTPEKRILVAKYAYRLYGAVIVYRNENSQYMPYQPTTEDEVAWRETQELNHKAEWTFDLVKKTLVQLPYLVGLYAGTFATSYLVGGTWIGLRCSREPT